MVVPILFVGFCKFRLSVTAWSEIHLRLKYCGILGNRKIRVQTQGQQFVNLQTVSLYPKGGYLFVNGLSSRISYIIPFLFNVNHFCFQFFFSSTS